MTQFQPRLNQIRLAVPPHVWNAYVCVIETPNTGNLNYFAGYLRCANEAKLIGDIDALFLLESLPVPRIGG